MSKLILAGNTMEKASRLVEATSMMMDEQEAVYPEGQFGFKALLQTPYVMLWNTDFDFEFDIPFDDDLIANEAEIIIYNLTDSTINKFKLGNSISITAGYGEDRGLVFQGFISKVKTVKDGVDKITTIYALDDVQYTPQMMKEVTYAKGTKASKILKDLLGRLNLPIAVFNPQRDHIYDSETKIEGSIVENIKEYSEVCGVSTYINKQQIYCRPIWEGNNLWFTVSADTGMIGSPEPFEEESTSEDYTDTVQGYNITMLFQYRLTTAGIVSVKSRNYTGDYRVASGTHSYDGLSATTEIKCIADIRTTKEASK